jgi:hypothetical protein
LIFWVAVATRAVRCAGIKQPSAKQRSLMPAFSSQCPIWTLCFALPKREGTSGRQSPRGGHRILGDCPAPTKAFFARRGSQNPSLTASGGAQCLRPAVSGAQQRSQIMQATRDQIVARIGRLGGERLRKRFRLIRPGWISSAETGGPRYQHFRPSIPTGAGTWGFDPRIFPAFHAPQALLQFRQECLALSIGLLRQSAGDNAAFPDSREHRIGSAAGP